MKKLLSLATIAALLLTALATCGKPVAPAVNPPLVLGEKYLTDLDYEAAVLQFEQAISIEPKNPRGYLGKADALLHLDRQDDAVQVLADGAKAAARDQRAALNEAKAEVEKSPVDGYIGLSFAYEKLGWRDIAIALLKRVCEELPEESRLREALDRLIYAIENPAVTEKPDKKTLNGYGEKEYPEGIYKGNFVSGKREGYGELTYTQAVESKKQAWLFLTYSGVWDSYAVGDVFKGQWKNDLKDGPGTAVKSAGKLEANWNEGELHGAYHATYTVGPQLKGHFEHGKPAKIEVYSEDKLEYSHAYEYDVSGETKRVTMSVNDEIVIYDVISREDDGRTVKYKVSGSSDGVYAATVKYREDGTFQQAETIRSNERTVVYYDAAGQPTRIESYHNGKLHGYSIIQPDGSSKTYLADGTLLD